MFVQQHQRLNGDHLTRILRPVASLSLAVLVTSANLADDPCQNQPPAQDRIGIPLFGQVCVTDDTGLYPFRYQSVSVDFGNPVGDYYFTSQPNGFAPLAVDDWIEYGDEAALEYWPPITLLQQQPTRPPLPPGDVGFADGTHIEENLVPEFSSEQYSALTPVPIAELVAALGNPISFRLRDEHPYDFGNTPVYLLRDHSMMMEKKTDGTVVAHYVSYEVQAGLRTDFLVDFVAGNVKDVRSDGGFADATCVSIPVNYTSITTWDPPAGEAYYYLAGGRWLNAVDQFGDSALNPDPREAIPCPSP